MKKLKLIGLALTLSMLYAVSAFAYASPYDHYRLEPYRKKNFTGIHEKIDPENYVTNEVIKLQNATSVDMYVVDENHNRISKSYNFKEKMIQAMKHNKKPGDYIGLGMQNSDSKTSVGFVWGYVNFR